MTLSRFRWDRIALVALLVLVVLVVAACAAPGAPGASGVPAPSATPHPPLTPAQPGADPISFLAWVFTPIFQVMFIILMAVFAPVATWLTGVSFVAATTGSARRSIAGTIRLGRSGVFWCAA